MTRRPLMAAAASLLAGLVAVASADAAGPAKPDDKWPGEQIKSVWFDGQPFTATAPDGTAFKMAYNPDGKSTKVQLGAKKVAPVGGFWRVIAEGYCVRWTGQVREKCFNVRKEGDLTVVRFGTQIVANWAK
ncbi:MAG: hypothetical protein P4L82_15270 [Ancalomicrobiaceae bacterium]|nr:hypothetical protein [Ancalomicrobiaceae bacterium]